MSIEERARRIIQRELQRTVILHDDGSAPGLYDLRVGPADAPEIAIECVRAVDRVRTETWNIGPARGSFSLNLQGDWYVALKPDARLKPIRARLEHLLQVCERHGLNRFAPVDSRLRHVDPSLYSAFRSLRISSVRCLRANGLGKVNLGLMASGDGSTRGVPQCLGGSVTSCPNPSKRMSLGSSGDPVRGNATCSYLLLWAGCRGRWSHT